MSPRWGARFRRALRVGLVSAWAGAFVAAGCTLTHPLGDYRGAANPDDAGLPPDSGDVHEGGADGSCGRAVPLRPDASDTPSGTGDLLLVLDALEMGNSVDALPFQGYNLDGLCTCPGISACRPPGNEKVVCDEPGGVDNAGGALIDDLFRLSGSSRTFTQRLREGPSLALQLRNYNGEPNDPEVEAMVLPVVAAGSGLKWDGTDVRQPNQAWLIQDGPPISRLFDLHAYVRDGWLVMNASGRIPIGELVLDMVDGRILARIEGRRIVEGHLMGRVQVESLLRAFSQVPSSSDPDAGICDSALFEGIKALGCKKLDVPATPSRDGRDTPCDALSFSPRFTAQPFILGPSLNVPPPSTDCGPTIAFVCP